MQQWLAYCIICCFCSWTLFKVLDPERSIRSIDNYFTILDIFFGKVGFPSIICYESCCWLSRSVSRSTSTENKFGIVENNATELKRTYLASCVYSMQSRFHDQIIRLCLISPSHSSLISILIICRPRPKQS